MGESGPAEVGPWARAHVEPHVAEVWRNVGSCMRVLSDPHFQVESVFETLVEHGPEEESTLTSKIHTCVCVREGGGRETICLCVSRGAGRPCLWVRKGVTAEVPFESLGFFPQNLATPSPACLEGEGAPHQIPKRMVPTPCRYSPDRGGRHGRWGVGTGVGVAPSHLELSSWPALSAGRESPYPSLQLSCPCAQGPGPSPHFQALLV